MYGWRAKQARDETTPQDHSPQARSGIARRALLSGTTPGISRRALLSGTTPGISRRALLSGTALAAAGLAARPAAARAAVTEAAVTEAGRAGAGLGAGPSGHTITFDPYSLMVDGNRLFVWSGEFHPFRLPSPALWLDILQKGFEAEFGGGWFDPWGGAPWQGQGYSYERALDGPAYERQFYLTNVANGIKLQNVYMTFGGTSWGWLPAPLVYTSYDYGAAISEPRQLTGKIPAMKEMGYFLQAVPDISKLDTAAPVTASNSLVKTYHLANPDSGASFFFVRNDHTADLTFTVPVSTADGSYTVPQAGTLQLNGKDMKVIVAGYALDSAHLVYSTSHLMTHAPVGGQDIALLASRPGDDGETVLRYPAAASGPAVRVLGGTGVTSSWNASTGDLLLGYPHQGVTRIQVTPAGGRPLLLLAVDDTAAGTFWRLDTAAGPVMVSGPALVRTATVRGAVLELTGDTAAATPLEVWAPRAAAVVLWNGRPVPVTRTASGSLASRNLLSGPPTVELPALTGWKYAAEKPEAIRHSTTAAGRWLTRPPRPVPPPYRPGSRCCSWTTTASTTATCGTAARGPARPAPPQSA